MRAFFLRLALLLIIVGVMLYQSALAQEEDATTTTPAPSESSITASPTEETTPAPTPEPSTLSPTLSPPPSSSPSVSRMPTMEPVNCSKYLEASDDLEAIAGEYIVKFRDDLEKVFNDEEVLEQVAEFLEMVPEANATIGEIQSYIFNALSLELNLTVQENATIDECGFTVPEIIHYMLLSDAVEYIEEEQWYNATTTTTTTTSSGVTIQTQTGPPWGLDRVDQTALPLNQQYLHAYTGNNTIVYVLDTGIRVTHEDFEGRASCGVDYSAGLFATSNCEDQNGHGTHVAGSVGGRIYGVAKRADLVAVKVLGALGIGRTSAIVEGMEWVVEQRLKPENDGKQIVINMSLGGGPSRTIDRAAREAVEAGIFIAAAAGNEDQDACWGSPARSVYAMTVGSTDENDRRSAFSNWGACVDIFAPGSMIPSAWFTSDSAFRTISGTSMACPHVAGVAALLYEADPNSTPEQIASNIIKGAVKNIVQDPKGSANEFLNVAAIVQQEQQPVTSAARRTRTIWGGFW